MEWKGTGDGSWSERNQWSCLSIKLWQCHAWLFATLDPRAFFSEGLSSCTFLSFNSHHSMELCVWWWLLLRPHPFSLLLFRRPFPSSLSSVSSPHSRVKETVWLCLMWPVTLEAVQLSPIGSEQKTINRHQLIPQRWHCSHNLGSTASSTRILLLWDQTCSKSIPACIKEIKCKGAYWQCNYKQATSKEKKRKRKRILLALLHASRWLGTAAAAWGFFLILLGISRNDVQASNVLVLGSCNCVALTHAQARLQ